MTEQAVLFERLHRNQCTFSECRRYRYVLRRTISDRGTGACCWVMANPSIANEYALDPTLTRCADFTARLGYREMVVVNVRAWVSTDPKGVPADPLGIGIDNDDHIVAAARQAEIVVCGYGKLGGARGLRVLELLRNVGVVPHALKLNADGSPQHPLYLKATLAPFAMKEALHG